MDMPMRCVSLIMAETVVEFGALPYIEDCVAASAAAPKPAGEMEARSASATATEKLMLKLRGEKGGGSAGGGSAGGSAGGGGEGGSGEDGGGVAVLACRAVLDVGIFVQMSRRLREVGLQGFPVADFAASKAATLGDVLHRRCTR